MIKIRTLFSHTLFLAGLIGLASCGTSVHRVHEKQRTPSDIQVSSLDLNKKQIELRFEYRTYVKKILLQMSCELTLNDSNAIVLTQQNTIELDAFSTEILTFENIEMPVINQKESINYIIRCEANYNKGKEFINKDSVLHRVPSSQHKYR